MQLKVCDKRLQWAADGWLEKRENRGCIGELITGSAPRVDLSGLTDSPEQAVRYRSQ